MPPGEFEFCSPALPRMNVTPLRIRFLHLLGWPTHPSKKHSDAPSGERFRAKPPKSGGVSFD